MHASNKVEPVTSSCSIAWIGISSTQSNKPNQPLAERVHCYCRSCSSCCGMTSASTGCDPVPESVRPGCTCQLALPRHPPWLLSLTRSKHTSRRASQPASRHGLRHTMKRYGSLSRRVPACRYMSQPVTNVPARHYMYQPVTTYASLSR